MTFTAKSAKKNLFKNVSVQPLNFLFSVKNIYVCLLHSIFWRFKLEIFHCNLLRLSFIILQLVFYT
jgi:hypothetical protein